MLIAVKVITPKLRPDWVIVPALNTGKLEQLLPALDCVDVLKWHANGGHIAASCIAASCIETFLLAETGLLDHLEATITWCLSP
jgi:transcriptional regulator GlxA family with amidase domain